jgi:hAT family C-terminal dimerisation region
MKRLYTRFFSISEQDDELTENLWQLFSNLEGYFDGTGICEGLSNYVVAIEDDAKCLNDSPDPIMVYKGMSIEGEHPPPLFKLAYHILSICPNLASCERLFSIFGNTLTKLRNCLGTKMLTSLAELKMHIRDEHVHEGEMKKRMKHFFGTAANVPGISPPSVPQVSTTAPEPSTLPPTPEMDVEMELDPAILRASDDVGNDFGCIVESFARLAEGDEDEGDVRMPSHILSLICQLFNFKKNHWVSLHEWSASRSLNEELEFYELLNLDAPGDEDVNLDVDSTLDSVLHV